MVKHGTYNFRSPRVGALIEVVPNGFNPTFRGKCIDYHDGIIFVDIDEKKLLPEEMRIKQVSVLDHYKVL